MKSIFPRLALLLPAFLVSATLAPAWAQFAYFLVAGLLWVLPAGLLIRWMQRPD